MRITLCTVVINLLILKTMIYIYTCTQFCDKTVNGYGVGTICYVQTVGHAKNQYVS